MARSDLLKALGFGGATLGAGAALHGAGLGKVLEPLDYPRQALYNLVKSPLKAMETGDASHLLGAIPGLAGAVLGGVVGGPVGVLAGSALGGALQGVGKASGREEFVAPSVSDITGTEDFLPNLAVGVATDPLTYAGLGATWGAGAKALKGMKAAATPIDDLVRAADTPVATLADDVPTAQFANQVRDTSVVPLATPANPEWVAQLDDTLHRYDEALGMNDLDKRFSELERLHRSFGLSDPHAEIRAFQRRAAGAADEVIPPTNYNEPLPARNPTRYTPAQSRELYDHAMDNYFEFGDPHSKAEARRVLTSLGYQNVDDVLEHEFMRRTLAGETTSGELGVLGADAVEDLTEEAVFAPGFDDGVDLPPQVNYSYTIPKGQPLPGAYSRLERALQSLPDELSTVSAKGKQKGDLMKQIRDAAGKTGGLSDEEIKWTGLDQYLAGKKSVTKGDLLKFFDKNKIEVEEVWRGTGTDVPQGRFGRFSTEGGENYRELLFRMKHKSGNLPPGYEMVEIDNPHGPAGKSYTVKRTDGGTVPMMGDHFPSEEQAVTALRYQLGEMYQEAHWNWGETNPDVFLHVRMKDRMTPQGKVLHIEEVQSQWSQDAAKAGGFRGDPVKLEFKTAMTPGGLETGITDLFNDGKNVGYILKEGDGTFTVHSGTNVSSGLKSMDIAKEEAAAAVRQSLDTAGRPPAHPFRDNKEVELGLKRMIKYAADNGYSKIALNPGEQVNKILTSGDNALLGQIKAYGTNKTPDEIADLILTNKIGKSNSEFYARDLKEAFDAGKLTKLEFDLGMGNITPEQAGKKFLEQTTIPDTLKKLAKKHGVEFEVQPIDVNPPQLTEIKKLQGVLDERIKLRDELLASGSETGRSLAATMDQQIEVLRGHIQQLGEAVPINQSFDPRSTWGREWLFEGDEILANMKPPFNAKAIPVKPSMRGDYPLLSAAPLAGIGASSLLAALYGQQRS